MKSEVYHASMRADMKRNLLQKIDLLLARMEIAATFKKHHLVAVKIHFGESGNTSFVRPVFVRRIVQAIAETRARVFVTDTSTLYRGSREDACRHLATAHQHGFTFGTLGAPVMIADGLRANAAVRKKVKGKHLSEVPIGEAIALADGLVAVSHFKLHEATGFGGALKNLGMGCATREGKLAMHSSVSPRVAADKCTGDAICVRTCTFGAISLVNRVAVIDEKRCTGCAECLGVCPHQAISVRWDAGTDLLQEKMVEFAAGAVAGKKDRSFFLNFVMRVSPACDCYPMNDAPIVPDLGIFASTDPVALDTACLDALQQAPGLPGSALKNALAPGDDKIADVYPSIRYTTQLDHAEKIGLGRKEYSLIPIG